MFARFLAPLLVTGFMLACTTDLPLEAQRVNHRPQAVTANPLIWQVSSIDLADGSPFAGTLTITGLTRDASGNILASGTVIQSGVLSPVSQTFSGIVVTFSTPTAQCVTVRVDLAPVELTALGTSVDFPGWLDLWKSTTDPAVFHALCGIIKGGTLDQLDRYLATINAAIGG